MKKSLTFKESILIASTLFGMFFGAGNLIFPVHMGQLAGSNVWPAIIGFAVTGVSIPILAVIAIGVTHSDGLQTLSNRVGRGYGYFFTTALYLSLGPFFAVPRCATVSFTVGIEGLLNEGAGTTIPLLIFSFCFFALVLFFSLRPGKIMIWIGKIINPLFLVFFFVLMLVAIFNPTVAISETAATGNYIDKALFQGFIEGYGTMDGMSGLVFAIIVIESINSLGVTDPSDVGKSTILPGIMAGALMALIYVITTVMGTQSLGALEISDNGGIALRQLSELYLGKTGMIVLAFAITLACLKTSIGLVTACGRTFEKMFPGKLSYSKWVVIFSVFSFAVSNVGLTAIINYSLPALMLLYPPTIVIIILALTEKKFSKSRDVYLWTMVGTLFAAFFDFLKALPFGLDVSFAAKFLPFFNLGFGWVVPSIIGFIVGFIIMKSKAGKATA